MLTTGFYIRIFLSQVKRYVPLFKMAPNRSIKDCILQHNWITKLDYSGTYFHTSVYGFQEILGFFFRTFKIFKFLALHFGLAIAPVGFCR